MHESQRNNVIKADASNQERFQININFTHTFHHTSDNLLLISIKRIQSLL